MGSIEEVSRPLTAKYNGVPGCPRVTVISTDKALGTALVESDEAAPGYERLTVPLAELSSFEGGEKS